MFLIFFVLNSLLLSYLAIKYFKQKPQYFVKDLYIYPIKSCHRVKVDKLELLKTGLKYDRIFCIVDEKNKLLNQRKLNYMAKILPEIIENENILRVRYKDKSKNDFVDIELNQTKESSHKIDFKIWESHCYGIIERDEVNKWFSECLGRNCKLVRVDNNLRDRKLHEKYINHDDCGEKLVSYADDAQILLISTDSLDELNRRLKKTYENTIKDNSYEIPMSRFRPNIVIQRTDSKYNNYGFIEDTFKDFFVGSTQLKTLYRSGRCAMITIDQELGCMSSHKELKYEPLKTLRSFRKIGNQNEVNLFGENSPLFGIKCNYYLKDKDKKIINIGDKIIY